MSFRLRIMLYILMTSVLSGCATIPSPGTPEAQFKEGERLFSQRHYEDAISQWKKVKESDASPELATQSELKIADAQFENKNYLEAAASYENFRKLHPKHDKAAYALYRLALCYFNQIENIDTEQTPVKNATATFYSFLIWYPASEYAADAGEKLEICRVKQLQYEIYVARFYLRTKKYQAAIRRLEEALTEFPKSRANDETLFVLGEAYLRNGEKVKGEQTLARLFSEFPSSKYVPQGKKLLKKL